MEQVKIFYEGVGDGEGELETKVNAWLNEQNNALIKSRHVTSDASGCLQIVIFYTINQPV